MRNQLTDEQIQLFQNKNGAYCMSVEIPEEVLDDLNIDAEGCISASGLLEKWAARLAKARSEKMYKKIGGYTIAQLIFDTSIVADPNKRKRKNVDLPQKANAKKKPNKLEAFKQQIIQWLAKGMSHAEIAKRLECHINTLKNYIKVLTLSGFIEPDGCRG